MTTHPRGSSSVAVLVCLLAVMAILPGRQAKAAGLEEFRKALGQDAHSIEGNPGFLDGEKGDFHLKADSPARGRGASAEDVPTDRDGKSRGQKFDLGAYQGD